MERYLRVSGYAKDEKLCTARSICKVPGIKKMRQANVINSAANDATKIPVSEGAAKTDQEHGKRTKFRLP